MNRFKVGTNFDDALIDKIVEANDQHRNSKVTEFYGSIREHAALAARPDFRLPSLSKAELAKYVRKALDNDIKFEYTLNSINPYGSRVNFATHLDEIKDIVKFLTDCGVHRVSVSNPMLLEVICGMQSHPQIEISTIMHVDTVTQIKYLHEKYGATKICSNLNKNRDFKWLGRATEYCKRNNIDLELMVNEFCGVGGNGYATHCVYRDSCYICHSTDKTLDDATMIDWYPMRLCTASRNTSPSNWLKMRFIRPEDLCFYNELGIDMFKITGRTGSTDYIIKVVNAYMNKKWSGNLLGLWKPLESIVKNKDEDFTSYDIPNEALTGFIDIWARNNHVCDYEVCGETCKYCDVFYDSIRKV